VTDKFEGDLLPESPGDRVSGARLVREVDFVKVQRGIDPGTRERLITVGFDEIFYRLTLEQSDFLRKSLGKHHKISVRKGRGDRQ
jgi:hypothetical protein